VPVPPAGFLRLVDRVNRIQFLSRSGLLEFLQFLSRVLDFDTGAEIMLLVPDCPLKFLL
jgi:hypothetical protein